MVIRSVGGKAKRQRFDAGVDCLLGFAQRDLAQLLTGDVLARADLVDVAQIALWGDYSVFQLERRSRLKPFQGLLNIGQIVGMANPVERG